MRLCGDERRRRLHGLELRALFDECNIAAPEMRPLWRTQFSELLSEAGGARKILAVAIARIRQRG